MFVFGSPAIFRLRPGAALVAAKEAVPQIAANAAHFAEEVDVLFA